MTKEGGQRNVAIVRLGRATDLASCESGEMMLRRNDQVLVKTSKGLVCGPVVMEPEPSWSSDELPLIIRKINAHDQERLEKNRGLQESALLYARTFIREHKYAIKIIAVEFNHAQTQVTFYFTSAQRVDFRQLVKALAKRFRARIDMRQIGVRDAAGHVGGTGSCGRELCCSSWLPEFKPISIRMAKDQNLGLNKEKLSGLCGRLRCCLRYEHELYREFQKNLPKLGKYVETSEGKGRVRDVNTLRRLITLQFQDKSTRRYTIDEGGLFILDLNSYQNDGV
jgi:cell fate regulator YaaT (PSP1 superfamily)